MSLTLRRGADESPDHFQVYSDQVRIGAIYQAHSTPGGERWYWGLNGVENGPGPFNGFVASLDEAKAGSPRHGGAGSRPRD
jgi:hypothetical protein